MAALARAGQHGLIWHGLAAAGALLDGRRRSVYQRAARVTLAAYGANQALKFVVRRRRPRLEGLPPLAATSTDLSFPSAHATTSFAAARALDGALPSPLLHATAVAMALSRPYLGVHYPSDVFAGAALGHALARALP